MDCKALDFERLYFSEEFEQLGFHCRLFASKHLKTDPLFEFIADAQRIFVF